MQWNEDDYDDMPDLVNSSDDEPPPSRARRPQSQRQPQPSTEGTTWRPPPATSRPAPPCANCGHESHQSRLAHEERMDSCYKLFGGLKRFWTSLVLAYVALLALDRTIKYPIQLLRAALVLFESLVHWLIWALEYLAYVPFVALVVWSLAGAGVWSWIKGGDVIWDDHFAGRAWRKLVLLHGSCLALIRLALPRKFRMPFYAILAVLALKRADRAVLGPRGLFSGPLWRWLESPFRGARRYFDDFVQESDEEEFLRKQGWTQDLIAQTRHARAELRHSQLAKREAAEDEDRRNVDAAASKMAKEEEKRRAACPATFAPAKPKAKQKKKRSAGA